MTEFLVRRNTVLEALRGSRRELVCLRLQTGADKKVMRPIREAAARRTVPVEEISKQKLGQMARDSRHQGVLLEVGPYPYSSIDEILSCAAERGQKPLLLMFDLLHGPQNIGALLRSAEACGVHGVIVQDRRAPEITPAVVQFSAGAAEHLLIAQETNLAAAIGRLKQEGVWIAGLDIEPDAKRPDEIDLDLPLALVVGHEGAGLRRLVRERCDFLLRLPMAGQVESLNAAAAGSIMLYTAWQARGFPGDRNPALRDGDS